MPELRIRTHTLMRCGGLRLEAVTASRVEGWYVVVREGTGEHAVFESLGEAIACFAAARERAVSRAEQPETAVSADAGGDSVAPSPAPLPANVTDLGDYRRRHQR